MNRYTVRHIEKKWYVWDRLRERPASGPHKDQYTATRHAAPLNTPRSRYEFMKAMYEK